MATRSDRASGRSLSRADVILACLPVLFVVTYGLGLLLVQTQSLAVGVAALACCPLICDGLFLNPPTDG